MRFAPQLLATALAVSTMSLALAHDDAPARSPVGSWKGVEPLP
jgi:hypothetical protein